MAQDNLNDGTEPEGAGEAESAGETNRRTRQMVAGAAIGIGSAAIVAALLYATRTKKQDKKPVPPIESD